MVCMFRVTHSSYIYVISVGSQKVLVILCTVISPVHDRHALTCKKINK